MATDSEAFDHRGIDPAALKRAEAAIDRLRRVYICEWAPDALDEMEAAVLALRRYANRDGTNEAERHDALLRLSHDMKGQAGTFGLDLLADFAASMHAVAAGNRCLGVREADVFLAHIMAMRTALSAAACDPDGVPGTALERELRRGLRRIVRQNLN